MRGLGFAALSSLTLLLTCCVTSAHAAATAEPFYKRFCMACHGANLEGGMGGSLVDDKWKYGNTPEALTKVIAEGTPNGMPPWKGLLTDAQIRAMATYILSKSLTDTPKAKPTAETSQQPHKINLATLAEGFDSLWAMDFMPNGDILVSEKQGKLWRLSDTSKTEITGMPQVRDQGQGGLMEVRVHNDGSANPWVYLSYSRLDDGSDGDTIIRDAESGGLTNMARNLKDRAPKLYDKKTNSPAMTAIVRGKIQGTDFVQQQTVYKAPSSSYSTRGQHFGGRIAFKDNYLFFSIGDRGSRPAAQDLTQPNGKIHRVHLDGTIPSDNPFVATDGALPSIWSYGHRNPQGLTLTHDGKLWSTEHGPKGGDETNLIEKGKNYGWPVITYGRNYSGTQITDITHKEGMEQPKHYWTPSIAVTAIAEYSGKEFSNWQDQLIVGSLRAQEMQRLKANAAGDVVESKIVLRDQGRIRDIRIDSNGVIYLVVNDVSRSNGRILKLTAK